MTALRQAKQTVLVFPTRPPIDVDTEEDPDNQLGLSEEEALVDDELYVDDTFVEESPKGAEGGQSPAQVAPALPNSSGPKGCEAPSNAATVNSRTLPAEYARLSRFATGKKISRFPETQKLWSSGKKDVLFRQWVANNGDPDAIERKLKVVASQKKEGEC